MSCTCFIIPQDVLDKLAKDAKLSKEIRDAMAHSARVSTEMRKLRLRAMALSGLGRSTSQTLSSLAKKPAITVYDCQHHQTLPGAPVTNPGKSSDVSASRAYMQTSAVADFYQKVFARNSVDNAGMTMMSSIHYGQNYNNAMWNGTQMVYGDGDNQIFIDFTAGNDVIGHELTHGVTQYTLRLGYSGDAGGLNESLSDCFGSMFRQWQANQDVTQADWLIGRDIMGPQAKTRGLTCLRNMANPADKAALAPQPTNYSQVTPGMDPHYSSGPPNLAFCLACKAVGGKSWEKVGQVWYKAMLGKASPSMKMKTFANRTRSLAKSTYGTSVFAAVDQAWKQVGL